MNETESEKWWELQIYENGVCSADKFYVSYDI